MATRNIKLLFYISQGGLGDALLTLDVLFRNLLGVTPLGLPSRAAVLVPQPDVRLLPRRDPLHHTLRHFCGFCGTPISYWSEQPRSEAEYIQLTLGSLLTEDLHNLEEIGLVPGESDDEDRMDVAAAAPAPEDRADSQLVGRNFTGIPWFEGLVSGSRLGSLQTARGARQSRDGRIRVEWEISEWTADDEDSNIGKRKRGDADTGDPGTTA